MLTETQKNIFIRAARIRLNNGEDIVEHFKTYKNLTDAEKEEILSFFSLSLYQSSNAEP